MRVVNLFCCHERKITATKKTLFTSSPHITVALALLVFIARIKPSYDLEDYCVRIIHAETQRIEKYAYPFHIWQVRTVLTNQIGIDINKR